MFKILGRKSEIIWQWCRGGGDSQYFLRFMFIKGQFQASVAYQSVVYKRKSVYKMFSNGCIDWSFSIARELTELFHDVGLNK